jgi:hypothetical protein
LLSIGRDALDGTFVLIRTPVRLSQWNRKLLMLLSLKARLDYFALSDFGRIRVVSRPE